MLQLLYSYDQELGEHVFVGGEWLIAGTVSIQKTQYWIVSGVPIFLNFIGSASVQFDGSWLAPSKKKGANAITAEELSKEGNLLGARFRYDSAPWCQIGANLTLQPGVGFCGVLDAHGTLQLSIVIRFTFGIGADMIDAVNGKNVDLKKSGGFMVDFSGGIGVTLLVIKVEFQLGGIKQGWRIYDTKGPVTRGTKLLGEDGEAIEFRPTLVPIETGQERDAQDDPRLMSVLEQIAVNPIKENTMEYISPKAVQLNEAGDVFMVYLSDNGNGDVANASTLKYMIRDADTGKYSDPIDVHGNGVGDFAPAVLHMPDQGNQGKIYVAWISAETPLRNLSGSDADDITATKDNLNKLEIYMRVYDIASGQWGEVIRVTEDNYADAYVRLIDEDGCVGLYYFKRNLDNIEKIDDLTSMTQSYNSWAKKLRQQLQPGGRYLGSEAADRSGEVLPAERLR